MKASPPRWLERLLERLIDPYLFNGIYGDLLEEYQAHFEKHGKAMANYRLFLACLGYLRYLRLFSIRLFASNGAGIFINYCKTTYRNLKFNRTNTAISMLGLVVSFVTALAIYQYVDFETSYDQYHPDHSRIYRVSHDFANASSRVQYASTFYAVNDAFEVIPEIELRTHFMNTGSVIKKDEEVFVEDDIIATTPEFFEMFGVELLKGNARDLNDPNIIMLSRSTATKYFGEEEAMGQLLEVQGVFGQTFEVKVAGVFQDVSPNTHFRADFILPGQKLKILLEDGTIFGPNISSYVVRWRWLSFHTYVKLQPGADMDRVMDQANQIVAENRKEINTQLNQEHSVWFQPVAEIHTTPGILAEPTPTTDEQLIRLFQWIGVIILVIAWINYINIATARAVTRAKEVGIRKVLGSHKSQLRFQFLLEAFLLNAVAMVLAILVMVPLQPTLEQLVGIQFQGVSALQLEQWVMAGIFVLAGTVLSGFYPALVLSRYSPVKVLKGKMSYTASGVNLRRGLVIVQLVFTLFLVSSLLIIQRQMDFMINHNLGVSIDQTILLDSPSNAGVDESYDTRIETLKTELLRISGIEQVTISSMVPGIQSFWRGSTESRNGEAAGIFLNRTNADEDYFSLYGLQFLEGRNFDRSFGADKHAIVVNELATRELGFDDPAQALQQKVYFTGNQTFTIVGVVNNFYQRGPQFAFEPRIYQLDTGRVGGFISVRFNTDQVERLNAEIETLFTAHFPDSPYNNRFLDAVFQAQYDSEKQFRNLFTSFTLVALVIAGMGLIGLASYLINQKTKEISIRKVMGAGNSTLFLLLNKEYVVISAVAFVLTIPVIIYLMDEWLNNYANRIDLDPGLFLLPFVTILVIILLITLHFTVKVIRSNPAVVLRENG